jgi:hypothetical protein
MNWPNGQPRVKGWQCSERCAPDMFRATLLESRSGVCRGCVGPMLNDGRRSLCRLAHHAHTKALGRIAIPGPIDEGTELNN